MAQDAEDDTAAEATGRRRSIWWRWIALPLLVVVAAVALVVWFQRHTIAGNVIDNYLRSHHVRASYKIEHIGGTREVLSDLVIGDPAHPDLTVERAEVAIRYRFGIPAIGGVTLVRPRLYGTYLHGKLKRLPGLVRLEDQRIERAEAELAVKVSAVQPRPHQNHAGDGGKAQADATKGRDFHMGEKHFRQIGIDQVIIGMPRQHMM